jgi:RHH-type proline utilization regulon transcriptional repressor/proline dehydrogenase/delta 1-pyrroline-5-carboxylate dehydrogenase
MSADPALWHNSSPGDLSFVFPETHSGPVEAAVEKSRGAFLCWSALSLDERRACLEKCRVALQDRSAQLAVLISRETGKPLREAKLEMAAVIAKFELTFADGEKHLRDSIVEDGPHPALVRRHPLGPAAVIAPYNFPIHLGHGATVAYLLAGNTVLFKPSPLAVNTGLAYAQAMQVGLPPGVFEIVPGWGEVGKSLCSHPAVRAVCFTGSLPVGRALSEMLARDYSKCLSLELGGKNSAIICANADLDLAAEAVADGMCLTAGQRCNATSRVLVHKKIAAAFLEKLLASVARYSPGDVLEESTMLGPLISFGARERYERLVSLDVGEWILPGGVLEKNSRDQHGYWVLPAITVVSDPSALDRLPLATDETFAPVLVVEMFSNDDEAVARHEAWKYGLTASIFTNDTVYFKRLGAGFSVGNLYQNLPTTFSPSTLPFGGWGSSGNGRPGARGFVRFGIREQAVQWRKSQS